MDRDCRLDFDECSIQKSSSGSITGVLFWTVDDQFFPDDKWNDFVVLVVSWWVRSVSRMLDGTSTAESLNFMDGPFSVECTVVNSVANCRYVDRRSEELIICDVNMELESLSSEIFAVAKSVLRSCHLEGIRTSDVVELEHGVEKLEESLR